MTSAKVPIWLVVALVGLLVAVIASGALGFIDAENTGRGITACVALIALVARRGPGDPPTTGAAALLVLGAGELGAGLTHVGGT